MSLQTSNISNLAAELAARFELGLSSHASIISWADKIIVELTQPPIELVNLSLSATNGAGVLELLEKLAVGSDPKSVQPALAAFRKQVNAGTIRLRDAISRMQDFAHRHSDAVGTEMRDFLVWADDEYDLIDRGYIDRTHEQLRAALDEQLRRSAGET